MAQKKREDIIRQGFGYVRQAMGLDRNVTFRQHKEKKYNDRWMTELYGKVQNVKGMQIGGQMPGGGPDVLKYIKQHDPDNSAGAVKKGLDIMMKLQDATLTNSLMGSIQPLQNILGGSLYSAMKSAGSKAKAQGKANKKKKKEKPEPLPGEPPAEEEEEEVSEEEASPDEDIVAELIAAAMETLSPEDLELAAELLDFNEIEKISIAYSSGGIYTSTVMPVAFVESINQLIPVFRATRGRNIGTV